MCIMYHSNRSWSIFNQIHPSWSPICSCVYYELLPLHYSGKYPSWYRNNRCDDKLSIFVKISKKGQTRGWILAHFYLSCSKYSLHSLFGRIGGLHLTYYLRWMNHQSHIVSPAVDHLSAVQGASSTQHHGFIVLDLCACCNC